ncbi:fatty-acyl-CoA synthase [Roseiarcus fermentans]|uniref:Fatty-acyl-CoA synthase n=1 Tax=Roseiarcus fermentans TaxID=1473586 RepID=A0A366FR43_9HYPH|nr:fatty acyl-CoA synthetase [Roseiarcus fermentans]RBP16195.1 fatty-acyl-CoA synthase [Roseiarcus fermentans]
MDPALRRQTLADTLRRSAWRAPERLGLACGAIRWSYRELHARCERLAAGLAGRGIGRGDRVAVRYALMRLGAVMVPINFMLQPDDVAFVLNHSGARLLACDGGMAEVAAKAAAAAPTVAELLWLPSEDGTAPAEGMTNALALIEAGGEPPGDGPDSFDVAQIVYTSGADSRPKGVRLTHDAILWQYVSCMVDAAICGDDVTVHALPLYHCAQLDVFLGPSIHAGGVNIVTAKPVPDTIVRLIETERATSFFAPPTVWISMLRAPGFDAADLSSLTKGYYAASIMPVEVMREMARRMPNVRLCNLYGQTEIAPLATLLGPEDQLRKPGSCGRPALNVATRVVDDSLHDVKPGEIGEIVYRSPDLMTGYDNDEARTAEAFRGGWFHSGDLATIDEEGYISVVDRKKDMIKTGGENVASREVEEAIYRLGGVSEVAVIDVPHPRWVEAVVAVVAPKDGAALDPDRVLEHAHKAPAGFTVPKRVVIAQTLPKNPSGKSLNSCARSISQSSGKRAPSERRSRSRAGEAEWASGSRMSSSRFCRRRASSAAGACRATR